MLTICSGQFTWGSERIAIHSSSDRGSDLQLGGTQDVWARVSFSIGAAVASVAEESGESDLTWGLFMSIHALTCPHLVQMVEPWGNYLSSYSHKNLSRGCNPATTSSGSITSLRKITKKITGKHGYCSSNDCRGPQCWMGQQHAPGQNSTLSYRYIVLTMFFTAKM